MCFFFSFFSIYISVYQFFSKDSSTRTSFSFQLLIKHSYCFNYATISSPYSVSLCSLLHAQVAMVFRGRDENRNGMCVEKVSVLYPNEERRDEKREKERECLSSGRKRHSMENLILVKLLLFRK